MKKVRSNRSELQDLIHIYTRDSHIIYEIAGTKPNTYIQETEGTRANSYIYIYS